MSTIAKAESPLKANASKIAFITMGCAKNEVDSSTMAKLLIDAGFTIIEDPSGADCVIVNTCAFIEAATEESIETILEAAELHSVQRGAPLVITGCMASRYGEDLTQEFPEVAAFVPCNEEESIVSILAPLIASSAGVDSTDQDSPSPLEQGAPSVYVKISDGCDRWCSYCTIPSIRGRYHSFPYETIASEVSTAVEQGAKEIVLIAQDTGNWGKDLPEEGGLPSLLDRLSSSFPDTWFRVMYIQPEGVTQELIDVMASHENLCSYLDIPFQHCNPRILKAMNRSGSTDEFLALIRSLRSALPSVTLRTTLIVGFPGETDDDFQELLAFVEEAALDYVGIFPYSREEGTRAFDLEDQIAEDIKLDRLQTLRDLADSISAMVIAERIGEETSVLVEGSEEDGQLFGRTQAQAPEVDGVTYIDRGVPGSFVSVRIEDTLFYEMEGVVLDG